MKTPLRNTIIRFSVALAFLGIISSCRKPSEPEKDPNAYHEEPMVNFDTLSGPLVRIDFAHVSNVAYLLIRSDKNDSLYEVNLWYGTEEVSKTYITTSDWLNDSSVFSYPPEDKDKDSVYLFINKTNAANIGIDILPSTDTKYSLGVKRVSTYLTPETVIYFACDYKYQRKDFIKADTANRRAAEVYIEKKIASSVGPDTAHHQDHASTRFYLHRYWNQ